MNSFSGPPTVLLGFSNILAYASKTGQNIYLDLLEFNNILGLESRNIYFLHIQTV